MGLVFRFILFCLLATSWAEAYTADDAAKTVVTDGSLRDTVKGFNYANGKGQGGWVVTVGEPGGFYVWANSKWNCTANHPITLQGASTNNRPTIAFDGADYNPIFFATVNAKLLTIKDLVFTCTNHQPTGSLIGVYGNGCGFRISNCRFLQSAASGFCINIGVNGDLSRTSGPFGLIDHCQFYLPGGVVYNAINIEANGNGANYGWHQPMSWGTTNVVMIENCAASRPDLAPNNAAFVESFDGARFCVRYCNLTNILISTHGVASGGKNGTLQVELYQNTFNFNDATRNVPYVYLSRGGSSVIYSNTVTYTDISEVPAVWTFWVECASSAYAAESCSNNFGPLKYPADYPAWQQVGYGSNTNGGHQSLCPVYIWGNTMAGTPKYCVWCFGTPPDCIDAPFMRSGVNIFTNGTVMPGYTALKYPHPFVSMGEAGPATGGGN